MLLTLGIGSAWGAEEYALYSGTITEGDYIIVSEGYAMNNTVTSSRLGNTAVTVTSDKISNPDATIIWHIAPSGNYWTIFSANVNKYAASTGAKNKAQLLASGTDDKSLWTVTGSTTYEFVNKANETANVNKNLRRNGDYGFACYATSTGSALSLYKKVEQSSGGEDPTPDPEDPETPGTGSSTGWVETAIADITASDIVVITMSKGGTTYALTSANGSSAAPTAVIVTVNGDKLAAEPTDVLKWNIATSGTGYIIYPNGINNKYLYCTNTNNGVRVGTGDAKVFTINSGYLYTNQTTDARHIGVYNAQDWRCYKPSSGAIATNISGQTLKFYKYVEVGSADKPATPTLTASQTFETETFTVEISAVDGATIYYTLDGSDPTEASTTYTASFTVNATTTVKAIAVKDGVASNVATATYTKVSVIEKTCAEAAALCTSSTESTDKYRVEGYVTAIETAYSAQYNNITVWMADTRNGGKVLQAFRATPTVEADKSVKVGDKIEVVGKLKLYNSTPEIVSGTYTITQLDPVYAVNITSAHGTVTATPASAVEGTEITLSVEVESGWVFQSWTVTDASSNAIEVTDNKFTMPASDVTVVANYTESVAADAVLKLSANGVETSNTYKVGETVKLPETIVNDCVKMFVGWSANASCAIAPEYAPGADFTLTAEEHTLYAVYATAAEGELTSIFSETFDACDGTGGNDGKWSGNGVAQGNLPDELSQLGHLLKAQMLMHVQNLVQVLQKVLHKHLLSL